MAPDDAPRPVLLLNRAARSGRSSIAAPAPEGQPGSLQQDIHVPGLCDLEADASVLSPSACAARVRRGESGRRRSAFQRLAAMDLA
jgi:chloramphenicol 3-O-phosphotransferase